MTVLKHSCIVYVATAYCTLVCRDGQLLVGILCIMHACNVYLSLFGGVQAKHSKNDCLNIELKL